MGTLPCDEHAEAVAPSPWDLQPLAARQCSTRGSASSLKSLQAYLSIFQIAVSVRKPWEAAEQCPLHGSYCHLGAGLPATLKHTTPFKLAHAWSVNRGECSIQVVGNDASSPCHLSFHLSRFSVNYNPDLPHGMNGPLQASFLLVRMLAKLQMYVAKGRVGQAGERNGSPMPAALLGAEFHGHFR